MAKDAKWYAGWVRLANAESADEKLTNLEAADFIEALAAELEAVKRERDAAVADLKEKHDCEYCKYYARQASKEPCSSCWIGTRKWEWRGVQEV